MGDKYSIVEPLGNHNINSKLERYWMGFTGPYGLKTTRIIQFDPYTAMSRRPIRYDMEKFHIDSNLPSEEWISESLTAFIREESIDADLSVPNAFSPEVVEDIYLGDEFLNEFLHNSEWENYLKVELPKNDSDEEMARCIYELLCNPQIASKKNKRNNDEKEFLEKILPLIQDKRRLLFVLPGFPFKDQNRFRVPHDASCVDFCEISFLIRIHSLIQTLYQVHPFGADAIILSDGRLYQEVFHVDNVSVEKYQQKLHEYRNRLNIQGDVSIIDLKEMIERADENREITKINTYISNVISEKFVETDIFQKLKQAMKWNLNSKQLLSSLSDSDAWKIIRLGLDNVGSEYKDKWLQYDKLAEQAAIKYSSVNLMLRWTGLIEKFFPESIRCTVHPKKNQFALASNYAWNGVGWSKRWPKNIHDITSVPFYTLGKEGRVKLARFYSDGNPCFFTLEDTKLSIDKAKKVLKPDNWNCDNIFGREFTIYNLDEFVALGRNDENFAWEREEMSDEYYRTLLEFRIGHYKKYGFGVHAIFMDGKLIGQMGLQVLNEQKDQLEYVIFLGKEYTGKGLGTKLLTYLFKRCKEEQIETVYGVIRVDNYVASHIIEKFGGVRLQTIPHYKQTGILYKISL